MLQGAIIGCGFFAINQLNAWRDIEVRDGSAGIVALCDTNADRLAEVAAAFSISRTYTDAALMLANEKLDFVDICTTAPSHRALVELAAAKRIPTICQKPLAPTIDDARAIVETCDRSGIPLMVHENFRWQSALLTLRDTLDSGRIGRPFWGRVSFRSAFDVYSGQPYLATGKRFIVEDLGVHLLDLARFLFGEVVSVTAQLSRVRQDIVGEDAATMMLSHKNGVTSIVDCSFASHLEDELFPQTLVEIDGFLGSLRLSAGYMLTVTDKNGGVEKRDLSPPVPSWGAKPWQNVQESVQLIQQHWIECLLAGREPATSGRDNLRTLALVDAAYDSASRASTVHLEGH